MKLYQNLNVTGSLTLTGSLNTVGTITATTLVVQTITSSVTAMTGSNIFGSSSINTQQFTGSVLISGSSTALNVNNGAFFISSSGQVGIGTISPSNLLTISSGNGTFAKFGDNGYLSHFNNGAYIIGGAEFNSTGAWTARSTSSAAIAINEVNSGAIVFITNTSLTSGSGFSPTERMRITSGGNVGIGNAGSSSIKMYLTSIGTTSSTYAVRFEDSSTNGLFYIRDDGYINSGVSSNSPYNLVRTGRVMMVDSGGGVGYQSSTRESKTNISNLTDVSFLYKLNPVSFNYRKSDGESNTFTDEFNEDLHYGLIADEVEKVNKELVFYNEKDGVKELAGVEYGKLTAVLIKAIQELSKELSDLKEIVATK
jgi:hypothetical protein